MKLLTYSLQTEAPDRQRLGALLPDGDRVAALQEGCLALRGTPSPFLTDMLSLLDGGAAALDEARQVMEFITVQQPPGCIYPLAPLRLAAPVPRPRSIRDCMVFAKHLIQATRTVVRWRFAPLARLDAWMERWRGRALLAPPSVWYERPVYYKGNPLSVIGPDAEVSWPDYTEKLDYELEFGIFIGRKGRNIPAAQARDSIAGYTIFNDFSARDVQFQKMQGRLGPAKGKDFDTGNVLGPYLVTADEVPDPYHLTMLARVNGQEWSRGSSADMHFSFEEIVAYISRSETLYPGEFMGSGTVGNGCGLELDRWLKPGDVVELEVERLGVLRNRVVRSEG